MSDKNSTKQEEKKGFFKRMMDKLDKKMEEKAKNAPCCSPGKDKEKGSSCC